ncbi:MAG: hypothetical protein O2948_08460 [Proteobacteria bacterium]|nr:hypothetical protein [Pseudomonadota bacterium]MDA0927993.1 hypothetical protein [Pseudomonadota bacterium]
MKKIHALTCFITLLASPLSAYAQIFPVIPTFNEATGVLEVPFVFYAGQSFYLSLTVSDPVALTLQADPAKVIDVSPSESSSDNTTADIVGTWTIDGSSDQFVFGADASFQMTQQAGVDAEACPDGGSELGTFRWTPQTGVFKALITTDENGECGLSHVPNVVRFLPDGNTMTLMIGNAAEATLTLQQ